MSETCACGHARLEEAQREIARYEGEMVRLVHLVAMAEKLEANRD